jgi:predicted nucleotidyltransferase
VLRVTVFDSAARTVDFVSRLSDVDVLVAVESASRSRPFSFEVDEARADISVYTIAELLEMAVHYSRLSLDAYFHYFMFARCIWTSPRSPLH